MKPLTVTHSVKYFGPVDTATYAELAPISFRTMVYLGTSNRVGTMSSQPCRRLEEFYPRWPSVPVSMARSYTCPVLAPIVGERRSPAGRTRLAAALPHAFVSYSLAREVPSETRPRPGVLDIPNDPSPIFGHAASALLVRNSGARHASRFIGVHLRSSAANIFVSILNHCPSTLCIAQHESQPPILSTRTPPPLLRPHRNTKRPQSRFRTLASRHPCQPAATPARPKPAPKPRGARLTITATRDLFSP